MVTILQVLRHALVLLLSITLGSSTSMTAQHVLTDTTSIASLRAATWADIDEIITVAFDAFSPGTAFKYTNPGYEQYKDYAKYCKKEDVKKFFREGVPDGVFINVITVPRADACVYDVCRDEKVVAFAGWKLVTKGDSDDIRSFWGFVPPSSASDSVGTHKGIDKLEYNCSLRLDENITRSDDHQRQLEDAKEKYIDSQFDNQLWLEVLVTHPTWDGHNFGAMNLQWGQNLAKKKGLPITLIATPAGYPLYRSVGFEDIQNVTLELLDGEGKLWYEAMKYEPA